MYNISAVPGLTTKQVFLLDMFINQKRTVLHNDILFCIALVTKNWPKVLYTSVTSLEVCPWKAL